MPGKKIARSPFCFLACSRFLCVGSHFFLVFILFFAGCHFRFVLLLSFSVVVVVVVVVCCAVLCLAEMQTEDDGEEGISDAVHAQMQAKWKELSKKRWVFFSCT